MVACRAISVPCCHNRKPARLYSNGKVDTRGGATWCMFNHPLCNIIVMYPAMAAHSTIITNYHTVTSYISRKHRPVADGPAPVAFHGFRFGGVLVGQGPPPQAQTRSEPRNIFYPSQKFRRPSTRQRASHMCYHPTPHPHAHSRPGQTKLSFNSISSAFPFALSPRAAILRTSLTPGGGAFSPPPNIPSLPFSPPFGSVVTTRPPAGAGCC